LDCGASWSAPNDAEASIATAKGGDDAIAFLIAQLPSRLLGIGEAQVVGLARAVGDARRAHQGQLGSS
jgi:hypothetical protein